MSSLNPPLWKSLDPNGDLRALGAEELSEFPRFASIWESLEQPMERRRFLRLMAASLAFAGLSSCFRMPFEKIVPYVREPEGMPPGESRDYASAFVFEGIAEGTLVRSREGRPLKIEGNPDHPATRGGSTPQMQADLLGVYDPGRTNAPRLLAAVSTWDEFYRALSSRREAWSANRGRGLRILSEPTTSPTLVRGMQLLAKAFPEMRWVQACAFPWRDAERRGLALRARAPVVAFPRLADAECIVSLGRDFLAPGGGSVRLAREFADGRRVRAGTRRMNRLHVAECSPSLSGAMADHRWTGGFDALGALLDALESALAGNGVEDEWVRRAAEDLRKNHGRSLVLAGDSLDAGIHSRVFALNERLGNVGRTLSLVRDPFADAAAIAPSTLDVLVGELERGEVEDLLILGGNPVYGFADRVDWAGLLKKVPFAVHLADFEDETSEHCRWVLPQAHALESWGDARAEDGTVTLQQPLIAPVFGGRTASELVAALGGTPGAGGRSLLAETWPALDQHLTRGFVEGSSAKPERSASGRVPIAQVTAAHRPIAQGSIAEGAEKAAITRAAKTDGDKSEEVDLLIRPSFALHDGRFAPNAWLQELPDPITKEVWGNSAWISPAQAARLSLLPGSFIRIETETGSALEFPVSIVPGLADQVVLLSGGYGRRRGGGVGDAVGRTVAPLPMRQGRVRARVAKASGLEPLVTTQMHQTMEGHEFVRTQTLAAFGRSPLRPSAPPPSFNPEGGPQPSAQIGWGMSIDLGACIGCQACVISCQAENNIPVVGREEVRRGREMHWLRVDRYFRGDAANPEILFQPVPCMHCEHAPCETVCPTAATVHSTDGLNQMVYNRCVGTRYCSNNCPYKVRRFNFFEYSKTSSELVALGRNPEVTVRSRGVMEKCTFCVQRIEKALIRSRIDRQPIRDGEVRTACQAACPTRAIAFGNIRDPSSEVSRAKSEPHDYALLEELGTRPRTTYLARVVNPMAAVAAGTDEGSHG